MLNQEIIDPKDVKIFHLRERIKKLEDCIDKFKKYDEERKEYYKFLVDEWQHDEDRHIIEGLKLKIKQQGKELHSITSKYAVLKHKGDYTDEQVDAMVKDFNKIALLKEMNTLRTENISLKRQLGECAAELIKLKNKC